MRKSLLLLAALVAPCVLGAQVVFPPSGAKPAPQLRDLLAPKISAPVDRVVAVVGHRSFGGSRVELEKCASGPGPDGGPGRRR